MESTWLLEGNCVVVFIFSVEKQIKTVQQLAPHHEVHKV